MKYKEVMFKSTKRVSRFNTGSHIYLPSDLIGKEIAGIIVLERDGEDEDYNPVTIREPACPRTTTHPNYEIEGEEEIPYPITPLMMKYNLNEEEIKRVSIISNMREERGMKMTEYELEEFIKRVVSERDNI